MNPRIVVQSVYNLEGHTVCSVLPRLHHASFSQQRLYYLKVTISYRLD